MLMRTTAHQQMPEDPSEIVTIKFIGQNTPIEPETEEPSEDSPTQEPEEKIIK